MKRNPQQIYLIRHGETAWSLSGQHTGRTDIPLTDNGRKMAEQLATVLAGEVFEQVMTSPLQRACESCTLAGLGPQAVVELDLSEWHYGDYEGLTTAEIQAQTPDWLLFRDGCPGGESPDQVGARVDRLIAKVRSVHGHVALFGHGHLFRVFAARWLDLPVLEGRRFMLYPATLSILSYYRGIPAVKRWNMLV